MSTRWPVDKIRNSALLKKVGKEDMEELVKVILLGKEDDEDSSTESASTSTSSDEEAVKSKQLKDDVFQQMASGEFIPPKFNPTVWAQALEQSTRLARCVRSFSRNTVGLGWHIEPIHPATEETTDEEKEVAKAQTEMLRDLFMYPNSEIPTSEIFYLMNVDKEATGNGYIEIVRDGAGQIVKMFHAPAVSVRKRIMKKEGGTKEVYGYVQIRGNQKRYFKEFGDRKAMDAVTGKWHEGKDEALEVSKRASEILHFKIYDPTSSYYGAPKFVPCATAIAGNRMAAVRNVSFFENDAVPRMAVLVSGGRLTSESMQQIEDFFRAKARGVDNAHRAMVLQVEPAKIGFQQQGKTMIELKPLTVGVTEDQSFGAYRKDNDEEIREIFGLAPVFITTENVNKASSQVSREITNEQEFEPDRLATEYILNQTIVYDVLTASFGNDPATPDDPKEMAEHRKKIRVRFRFARLTLIDPLDQARMDQIYAALGAMTPNELRERIGKAPFPSDYFFADKPMAIALAELSAQLALAIATNPEEAFPAPPAPEGEEGGEEGGLGPVGEPEFVPGSNGAPPIVRLSPLGKPDGGKTARAIAPPPMSSPKPPPTPKPPKSKTPSPSKPRVPLAIARKTVLSREQGFKIVADLMADARNFAKAGSVAIHGGNDGA